MLKSPSVSSHPQELLIITSLRYWRSSRRGRELKPFRMLSNPACSNKIGRVQLQIRQYRRCAGSFRFLIFLAIQAEKREGLYGALSGRTELSGRPNDFG